MTDNLSTLSDTGLVERVARAIFDATANSAWEPSDLDRLWTDDEDGAEEARVAARAAIRVISVALLSDTDLLKRFHAVPWEAGEPEHEALLGEVQRRNLDF